MDKTVELNIRDMAQNFSGRIRMSGAINQSRCVMETALTYTLQRVCWQFFGSLTFAESDIQVLMAVGKLTPLGDPAPNAPKWFAAVEMIQLAADKDWLHKATKEISKFWRLKRERRMNPPDVKAGFGPAQASNQTVFSGHNGQSRQ